MDEYTQFTLDSTEKAQDPQHRKVINNATTNHRLKYDHARTERYKDWNASRALAGDIKDYALATLPGLLETFEANASRNGVVVHWAEDVDEAQQLILNLAKEHQVNSVVKSKSMTTEEIGLNECLAENSIEVFETDLGELIVQLRNEKPYHLLTPAMHLNREAIAELFEEKLGTPHDADAGTLTMAARDYLRQRFINADMGISGANFLLAEEGAMVLVENEGNARLTVSCPPIHVAIVGIEKVIPSANELRFLLPQLITAGTGQRLNTYTSIIKGPKGEGELDGPREMHIILLDNGRSQLLAEPELRKSLRCIRCGACLNACPVYRAIGGHAYHAVYQGPIGSTITPHLKSLQDYQHLAQASTLCGACTDTCPVSIPLHELIHHNRVLADQHKANDASWRLALRAWSKAAGGRTRMDLAVKGYKIFDWLAKTVVPDEISDRLPEPAEKSFSELWKDHEQQK